MSTTEDAPAIQCGSFHVDDQGKRVYPAAPTPPPVPPPWETRWLPENGTWCWVSDGRRVWVSRLLDHYWGDNDDEIKYWIPLNQPGPPCWVAYGK
jgi:hypothetical protein